MSLRRKKKLEALSKELISDSICSNKESLLMQTKQTDISYSVKKYHP
jgi:hypothetical protein